MTSWPKRHVNYRLSNNLLIVKASVKVWMSSAVFVSRPVIPLSLIRHPARDRLYVDVVHVRHGGKPDSALIVPT